MGLGVIPATGKKFTMAIQVAHTAENGKIVHSPAISAANFGFEYGLAQIGVELSKPAKAMIFKQLILRQQAKSQRI